METDNANGLEIAVIGMAVRFPGARNVTQFLENLENSVESVRFFSPEELIDAGVDPETVNNRDYIRARGYLDDADCFDAGFFGYTPGEALMMDPQLRLFHECVWEALEDSGYDPAAYDGSIGLYGGATGNLYWQVLSMFAGGGHGLDPFSVGQLTNKDNLTMRVSYNLDLGGPSYSLNTACSTSLTAIHIAAQALLSGECNMALAGGVTVTFPNKSGYMYEEGMVSSPDGHCRAFDAAARGTIGGDGVGVVVLKVLEDAVEDNDHIYAVIKGSAINNDGRNKTGYTAPGIRGQAGVIRAARKIAEVEPESIRYIEAHGTGTVLGDPIEIEALKQAFGTDKRQFCGIGSVKTNFGHLDSAAGVAGFVKTVLSIKEKKLFPSLHYNTPNPKIDIQDSPFYVVDRLIHLDQKGDRPIRAGVSSFGIGGTNCHVILEEYVEEQTASSDQDMQLLTVSAKTADALHESVDNFINYFKRNPGVSMRDAAYTMQVGRRGFQYRTAVVATNQKEAVEKLSSARSRVFTANEKQRVVFLFSGLGGQYENMGLELYHHLPTFRDAMDECFQSIAPHIDFDLKNIIYPGTGMIHHALALIHTPLASQLSIFTFEYALAKLLISWGIQPSAMIGYSFGEYVAAAVSGVFSLEDALNLIVARGKLVEEVPGGAMMSVPLPRQELEPLLNKNISIAIDNGSTCIVSGTSEAVREFESQMKQRRLLCMVLPHASHALHSSSMSPILDRFETALRGIRLNEPQVPYISNVTGTWISSGEASDPRYWSRHLSETVYFADGLQELLKQPDTVFIEIGPGGDIAAMVKREMEETRGQRVLDLVRNPMRKDSDLEYLFKRLGYLWSYGVSIDWEALHKSRGAVPRRVSLPTYPFRRQKFGADHSLFTVGRRILSGNLQGDLLQQIKDAQWSPDLPEETETAPITAGERPPELDTAYVAPQDPSQEKLADIWGNFFGIRPIGINDDFFDLGGDSLKAMNVANLIQKEFRVEVPVARFFQHRTIDGLSRYIRDNAGEEETIPLEPVKEQQYYPLSPAQERLYVLHQMEPESIAYNEPMVVELAGPLDSSKLEQTFKQLIQRHESLRTSFHIIDGVPVQRIHPGIDFSVRDFSSKYVLLDLWDLSVLSDFTRPFDLETAPLLRVGLVSRGEANHLLMVDLHHIISDGTTQTVITRDFMALYNGEHLPPLAVQYKDFAHWQNRLIESGRMEKQEQYWIGQFNDDVPRLELPYDFPRPEVFRFEGQKFEFQLTATETAALRELASRESVTLFMLLLGLFNVLLSKLGGGDDVVVGSPIAGRRHADLKDIVGVFINTLAFRNFPLEDQTFRAFLEEVRENALAAFDNQDYPFDDLVEKVVKSRDTGRHPLFDVMLVLQNMQAGTVEIPGLSLKPVAFDPGIARFDIVLTGFEAGDKLLFTMEYNTSLFKPGTIERFAGYFRDLVRNIPAQVEKQLWEIDIISETEKQQLLYAFNDTAAGYPRDKTIHELFEQQAAATPSNIAVSGPSMVSGSHEEWTYEQLNHRADQLAGWLNRRGVGPGSIVALQMERGIEIISTILGILKCGAAYLPIDPVTPPERIGFILSDSNARLMLTIDDVKESQTEKEFFPVPRNRSVSFPSSPAYVIYTSGTTGKPKGVVVEHRNVVRLMINDKNRFQFDGNDVWTLFHSCSFDFSVWEMYGALLYGGRLVVVSSDVARDPRQFLQLLNRYSVTVLNQTPSSFYQLAHEAMAAPGIRLEHLRYVIFGGEALSPGKLEQWRSRFPHVKLINMYGITETTVHVTYKEIGEAEISAGISNIGVPIPTLTLYVMDSRLRLCPIGVPGELCVGGDGVARGYLGRPQLTHEKFVPNPCKPGERLYRSGDQGRVLPNGEIEYIGRIDQQVKIRGFRIEPGEIEARLISHPDVKEAVVLARTGESGDKSLAAYIVPAGETSGKTSIKQGPLKEFLAQSLPPYMIPAFFIPLEKIPLTRNGKVDRKTLSAISITADGSIGHEAEEIVPPQNPLQEKLVNTWKRVLEIDNLGIRDNFFNIGGDSIKAIKLVHAINSELETDLRIPDLYIDETIEKLSRKIGETGIAPEETGLEQVITELEELKAQVLADGRYSDIDDVYPMSDIQKGMVFHSLRDEGAVYHDQFPYQMVYPGFDFTRFNHAVSLMVEKHHTLRCGFNVDDFPQPLQVVYKTVSPDIRHVDISGMNQGEQHKYIREIMAEDRLKPFDTACAPLWRMRVLELGSGAVCVLWIIHHAIIDGWSNASLMTELNNIYLTLKDDPGFKPQPLKSSYKDYVVEQLAEKRNSRTIDYWKFQLEDYKRLELPGVPGFTGEIGTGGMVYVTRQPGPDLYPRLEQAARRQDTAVKHLFFAAYLYMLYMVSHENDIVTGLVTNNRPVCEDGDRILGCFLNTVPVRVVIPETVTWAEYIRLVHGKLAELPRYHRLSLYEIVRLTGDGAGEGNPIFDTLFNFTDFHVYKQARVDETAAGDGEANRLEIREYENTNTLFDFAVNIGDRDFRVNMSHAEGFLDHGLAERMCDYFLEILEQFIDFPESLAAKENILPDDEKEKLLIEFNCTGHSCPIEDKTVMDYFGEQVEKRPDTVALFCGEHLTYRELDRRAGALAVYLRETGVVPGDIVALNTPRRAEMFIGILGILKAGAAYMPIAPDYPQKRVDYMLADSGAALLTMDEITHTTAGAGTGMVAASVESSSNLCYVIYTSGTTGNPKGVMVEHGNVVNLIHGLDDIIYQRYAEWRTLRVAMVAPFIFDASVQQIFGVLLLGRTLYPVPDESRVDGEQLAGYYRRHQIDISDGTPTHIKLLAETGSGDIPVTHFIIGGEALPSKTVEDFQSRFGNDITITNVYGPTECCVDSTYFEIPCNNENLPDLIPIGRAMPNEAVYIIDKNNQPQPLGVPGELCIAGHGVGRGYLNTPELTNEKFNSKFYMTGDLACWLKNGDIQFLGRIDQQVKIRGYRIELQEIEAQLRRHPVVRDAAVVVKELDTPVLCAYLLADEPVSHAQVREYLEEILPVYMIPSYFVQLEQFPLTPSGKLHRRALPDPRPVAAAEFEAPTQHVDTMLTQIMQEVMGVPRVGVSDNFYQLGGDSIKAIQVAARLNKHGLKLEIRHLLSNPVIRDMAGYIEEQTRAIPQEPVTGGIPLTPVQADFFDNRDDYRFTQAFLFYKQDGFDVTLLEQVFAELAAHHDALRMTYRWDNSKVVQENQSPGVTAFRLETIDLTHCGPEELEEEIPTHGSRIQASLDPFNGPLAGVGLFKTVDGDHLLVAIHHLVVDTISWQIILEDMATLYRQISEGESPGLPAKTDSFQYWSQRLVNYSRSPGLLEQLEYWQQIEILEPAVLPADFDVSPDDLHSKYAQTAVFTLNEEETLQLLRDVNQTYNTEINDILLTALAIGIMKWKGIRSIAVNLEGHGREAIVSPLDISRTVGWFTAQYPVVLDVDNPGEIDKNIVHVKETLRRVPGKGIGYGVLKHLTPGELKNNIPFRLQPEISFNYLGQFDPQTGGGGMLTASPYHAGPNVPPGIPMRYKLDINGAVTGGVFSLVFTFNSKQYRETSIRQLTEHCKNSLLEIIGHCTGSGEVKKTASDFTVDNMDQEELDTLFDVLEETFE